MMTEDATDRVARIRRAFDAAFQRMCEAENPEAAEDELSNVLSQVYRLSGGCPARRGTSAAAR